MKMNKNLMIGRPTKDVELKVTASGTNYINVNLAVDRPFLNKEGAREADFIPLTLFGKITETAVKFMRKGKLVGISGALRSRNYKDKDGNNRSSLSVYVDEITIIEWPERDGEGNPEKSTKAAYKAPAATEAPEEDLSNLFGDIDVEDVF